MGRSALAEQGFRERVIYLDPNWLPPTAMDAAADAPTLLGVEALNIATDIHAALTDPADAFAAECGILARRLWEMLEDRLVEWFTIAEAAAELGAHRSHLVPVFTTTFGIAPHQRMSSANESTARRLLLARHTSAEAAVESRFHDQVHPTCHFRSTLGTPPEVFAT